MNFHIPAINYDKVLKISVTIIIAIYLIISLVKNVDFSKFGEGVNTIKDGIKLVDIYNYLDESDNYYYKIEGAVYCISKDELVESGKIGQTFIDNMPNNYIEAKYINGQFEVEYKDICIPN